MANLADVGRRLGVIPQRKEKHPVRVSALWVLKEVLMQEKYEECAEIIAIAKEFGASDFEIYYLLEDPRRKP